VNRRAFSLIEMLLATVLVAVLMGGVLMLLGGVNRDVRTMRQISPQDNSALMELISRDLSNAIAVRWDEGERWITAAGNVGIDQRTMRSDGRLARVTYRIDSRNVLHREQIYLDDSARPQPWSELAGMGIRGLTVVRESDNARRGQLVIATARGSVTCELRLQ
jgi:prepilin-type N-terminal cleavage/methylation domain-containing protein